MTEGRGDIESRARVTVLARSGEDLLIRCLLCIRNETSLGVGIVLA